MNIFILDEDIERSVSYYVDKHVVKMILESTQILSTVNRLRGLDQGYSITHVHHPCVIWCDESLENYLYLKHLAYSIIKEWRYRFHNGLRTPHRCEAVLDSLDTPVFLNHDMTLPAICMPEYCKIENDVIQSYRNYYNSEKQHIAKWTKRPVPEWFSYK